MRTWLPAIAIFFVGCTSVLAPNCRGTDWPVPPESLQRRVADVDRERAAFLKTFSNENDLQSLSAPERESIEQDFGTKFDELKAASAAGAQVWRFRYDKCPRCGWFREGYVAVEGCKVVYELETLDTM